LTQRAGPAQRFRSPDGAQNRKIFLTFFNCAPPKFFSIKETKIFLFCLPAIAGIAETPSLPQPRFAGQSRRAKIHFPHIPFSFCPPAFGLRPIFFGGISLWIFNGRPCPSTPNAGDTKELPEICLTILLL
jgi:hypothetical protein